MTAQPKPAPAAELDADEPTAYTEGFPCAGIEVSPEAYELMLEDPPPPPEALVAALARHRKLAGK